MKQVLTVVLILVLALSVVGVAQEMKKEMKKDNKSDMMKEKGMMMKEFVCKPECGFMVRSHDESEIMSMAKMHGKQQHNMDMTDEQVKEMMHDAKPMMRKSMMKDGMKKDEMKKEEMKH
jgi:predicted small metal-binding protein